MTKYVALLRGINVGGRIIKMADLKACCEKAGLQKVSTVLQSGNVVFESDSQNLKNLLENALAESFNYPAKVQIVKAETLQEIIDVYPFDSSDETLQHYVIFLENNLEKELIKEGITDPKVEQTAVGQGVIYWKVQKGMTLKSSFAKYLTKAKYRDFNTNRNLKTLRKLV